MTKRQAQRVQEVLFRESRGTKCDFTQLSRITGIPASTLHRYKANPESIPFGRVLVVAEAMQLTAQESAYLITGKKA